MDSRVVLENSKLSKELKLVEYPGIVKNDDKMLETLGGLSRVSQVLCEQIKRMELVLHPANRYAKPAYGDPHKIAGIVIKIRVRRQKPGPSRSDQHTTHAVEVLGHCKKSYKFNSLFDFQYLPLVRNPETNHFEYIYDRLMPKGIPSVDWLHDADQPLFVVPSVFARSDTINTNLYRLDHHASKSDGDVLGTLRSRTNDSKLYCTFSLTDSLPTKPNPIVYKAMMAKLVNDHQFLEVKKLFDECPVWNSVALLYEASITLDKLKCILPSLSFYYTTGPWRTMYVRYGYDPRKHFESRYYQTFDFRIRLSAKLGNHIKTKRKNINSKSFDMMDLAPEGPGTLQQDYNYPYLDGERLPRGRQCFYRYCDLRIPKVKEMLDKLPTPLSGATCNEKTGWFPPGFNNEVRSIVTVTVKQYIQKWRQDLGQDGEGDGDDDEDEYFDEEDDELEYDEDADDGANDEMDVDTFMEEVLGTMEE